MIRVMVLDDHPLVYEGLEAVLQHDPQIELVGLAQNTASAETLFEQTKPDLVLVDLRLPGESGLGFIKKMKAKQVEAKMVVLTSSSWPGEISEALDMGVDGYMLKDSLPEELISAIKRVASGRKHYDARVAELAVQRTSSVANVLRDLTEREIEVLRELSQGLTNRQIAEQLFITENTVKKHISSILSKLSLEDRTQAALFAVEHKEWLRKRS